MRRTFPKTLTNLDFSGERIAVLHLNGFHPHPTNEFAPVNYTALMARESPETSVDM
jgi:hypothetical protein